MYVAGQEPAVRVYDRRYCGVDPTASARSSQRCAKAGVDDRTLRTFQKQEIAGSPGALALMETGHLQGNRQHVTGIALSYDGSQLLASFSGQNVFLFDTLVAAPSAAAEAAAAETTTTGTHLREYGGHRNSATVKDVSFLGARSELCMSGSGTASLLCLSVCPQLFALN